MPWLTAPVIGGVIAGGGALLGGALGSSAAKKAANAQAEATQGATAEQRREYDQARADNAPFQQTGTAANKRLRSLLGLSATGPSSATSGYIPQEQFDSEAYLKANPDVATDAYYGQNPYEHYIKNGINEGRQGYAMAAPTDADAQNSPLLRKFTTADLNADPVYNSGLQFGLDEGEKGINARALQSGSYDSGATLKALTRFGNDYGSTKANDSYNRFTNDQSNTFNKLSGVSGSGQVATNTVTSAGTNMANNVSSNIDSAGNARAAGIVGGANAWGGALTGLSSGYNQYQNSQILQKLLSNSKTGTSGGVAYGTPGYYGLGES